MFSKSRILLLGLLVLVLAGCSLAGGALLPNVPTRTPGAELTRPVPPTAIPEATVTLAPIAVPTAPAQPTATSPPPEPTATAPPAPTATGVPFDLPPPPPVLTARGDVQTYEGPGRHFAALHILPAGTRANVTGRSLDNSWLVIAGPGDGPGPGVWVAAANVILEGDVNLVGIVDPPEVEAGLFPIVDAETGFLLGGWADSCLDADETVARLKPLPYRIYVDSLPAGAVEGRPFPAAGGPCPEPIVQFDGLIPSSSVALLAAATWAPNVRPVTAMEPTAPLRAQVERLLQEKGIADPDVRIDAIQRVDLEGDALDEILITAVRLGDGSGGRAVNAGDYAVVALQPANGTPLQPLVLDVYLEADEQALPYRPAVTGILDVNGDGIMEIVVRALRHEGFQVTLFQRTLPLLTVDCHL
ncbi:MAG: hypothetical protein RRC07_04440 [Anaerolineae bacterium]|nr:hypothetical protein [Anaerolineae bacterium]